MPTVLSKKPSPDHNFRSNQASHTRAIPPRPFQQDRQTFELADRLFSCPRAQALRDYTRARSQILRGGSTSMLRVSSIQAEEEIYSSGLSKAEKHVPWNAVEEAETNSVSMGPPSSMHIVVRTPAESEAYDLQTIEKNL